MKITYLVTTSRSSARFNEFQGMAGVERTQQFKFRALILASKHLEMPPKYRIHMSFAGDKWAENIHWVKGTLLQELHADFLTTPPASKRARAAVVRRVELRTQELRDAEARCDVLREQLQSDSRVLVATLGKGPVMLFGEVHHPAAKYERVYFLKDWVTGEEKQEEES